MQLWFVFSLIFSIIIAAFAVLNSDTVTIRFFWESVQLSQSLVILLSATIGAAIVLFLGLFRTIKTSLNMRELNGKYNKAEMEITRLNNVIKNYEQKANTIPDRIEEGESIDKQPELKAGETGEKMISE